MINLTIDLLDKDSIKKSIEILNKLVEESKEPVQQPRTVEAVTEEPVTIVVNEEAENKEVDLVEFAKRVVNSGNKALMVKFQNVIKGRGYTKVSQITDEEEKMDIISLFDGELL